MSSLVGALAALTCVATFAAALRPAISTCNRTKEERREG
jgi:hypothetical protein